MCQALGTQRDNEGLLPLLAGRESSGNHSAQPQDRLSNRGVSGGGEGGHWGRAYLSWAWTGKSE